MMYFYTTRQIEFPCDAQFYEMLFYQKSKSNSKLMFEWLIVLFQFVFQLLKKIMFTKLLLNEEIDGGGKCQ